jgi:hypothetical protein
VAAARGIERRALAVTEAPDPEAAPTASLVWYSDGMSESPDLTPREKILQEHADTVLEVKERAQPVFGEMILDEMDYLADCGFAKEQAYLPAVNNLGMRKLVIQRELLAELGRLQGEMKHKLQRLAEYEEDFSPEP